MSERKQSDYQRAGITYSAIETESNSLAEIEKLTNRLDYLISGLRAGIDLREAEHRHPTFWKNIWGHKH